MPGLTCIVCSAPLVRRSTRGVPPRYCDAHRPTWRAESPPDWNRPQTYARRDNRQIDGSDRELVALYQAGDEAAFAAIYQRYAPRLMVYIWRRCNDWHMAEDLVQEAMLQAARYIPHGTMHDLNGYLILVVRQIWWMRATQMRRRPATEPFDPHGTYRGQLGFVENDVTERETIQEVIALLDCLPDDEREVATLKLLYGYDIPGTAQALGRGRSSIGAAWRRCSRKFAAWAGTKSHYDALDQALILARYPDAGREPMQGAKLRTSAPRIRALRVPRRIDAGAAAAACGESRRAGRRGDRRMNNPALIVPGAPALPPPSRYVKFGDLMICQDCKMAAAYCKCASGPPRDVGSTDMGSAESSLNKRIAECQGSK